MNWDNFDHWRTRQYDMFIWWKGMSIREMERDLNEGYTGQDFIKIHLHGEWPNDS